MSRRRLVLGLAAAAVAAAAALWYPTDERRVRHRFELLARYVQKDAGEPALAGANKCRLLADLFTDPFRLEAGEDVPFTEFAPRELAALAARERARWRTVSLRFRDLRVAFPEPGRARADFSAVLVLDPGGGRPEYDAREGVCDLVEADDGWRFQRCRAVEVLER
ncbi:hypothetical protein G3N55_06290 [Dissulfurirhabdus thermomarina]|uniref:Nuclear transport factor 2 family protein n=1 Tax=Dissulfurirhabdus thermomarina TaxID=1765737 RepID=A0A6N9TPT5_DISTH|nr:hypothetical protein [Dissulfurirhabdus thermomarina]NDY42450.1 hypothetical protein [Dissulfurirhabdus thermomarina]NMX23386.1 hypothetical protein [Dissulfurirhabdus thermomarina]